MAAREGVGAALFERRLRIGCKRVTSVEVKSDETSFKERTKRLGVIWPSLTAH
jgi:hypothetical protein